MERTRAGADDPVEEEEGARGLLAWAMRSAFREEGGRWPGGTETRHLWTLPVNASCPEHRCGT